MNKIVENPFLGSAITKQPGVDGGKRDSGKMYQIRGVFEGNIHKIGHWIQTIWVTWFYGYVGGHCPIDFTFLSNHKPTPN